MRQITHEDRTEDADTQQAVLANLRHNLRTPMNAILGYSEMLLEEQEHQDNRTVLATLQKIHLFGKQILAAIETVLNMAHLEASQSRLNVGDVGESFRVSLRSPLNAVIGNCELLLEMVVEDCIPDVEKIRTAAQYLLTTIDDIIEAHKSHTDPPGIMAFDSEPETLVDASQDAAIALRVSKKEMPRDRITPPGTILVVDDNDVNRDLLARKLEKQGHQVSTAANGQQALQQVAVELYDLILLDIIMPEMNGYEVLEQLKADEANCHIPVLVISALDEIDSAVSCLERGAEDYLPKPFNSVLLKARVDACLEKKRLRDLEIALNQRLQTENARLNHLNEQLQIQIAERQQSEAKEREKSQQLAKALQQLQQTQMQLVQSEKMSSLGQLVAGVAHEINNPVSCIHGNLPYASLYIQNLLQIVDLYQRKFPQADGEIRELIEDVDLDFLKRDLPKLLFAMDTGAERIREIVRSLRLFSRSDRGQKQTADLHESLDSTLMILGNRLKASPESPAIQVIKQYGDLPRVKCYVGQINQVFMNIFANAIDALEDNGNKKEQRIENNEQKTDKSFVPSSLPDAHPPIVKPQIRICTEALDNNWISICIEDNGPGMTETVKQQLFNPFFTTKPVGKGTGMGLSISYQIVTEKHGGKLSCTSAPGQGTAFTIEIPIR